MNLLRVSCRRLFANDTLRKSMVNKYSTSFETSDIQATVTDDGQTIVCMHREPSFPYEHTRPLPDIEEKYTEDTSVLKHECVKETDDILYNRDYTIEELMQITYTNKHRWYPKRKKGKFYPDPIPRAGI